MARCRGAVFVSCQRNRAGLPCTQNPAGRCGHRPLRRMIDPVRRAEVRQKSQPRPGGYIIRPYMHAPPFPVVGACIFVLNIPLPYSLLPIPSHKKIRLAKKQVGFFMLALPIFPCSHPQSIVGEGELNFCVRDGNRWTLTPINTNFVETNSISLASTQASKLSHSIVSPLKITNASLVCDFVFQDVP